MDAITYQVTIKKDYASAILEDLRMDDAIEFMPNDIPQWQIDKSLNRLKKMKENPSSTMNSENFFNSIPDDAE